MASDIESLKQEARNKTGVLEASKKFSERRTPTWIVRLQCTELKLNDSFDERMEGKVSKYLRGKENLPLNEVLLWEMFFIKVSETSRNVDEELAYVQKWVDGVGGEMTDYQEKTSESLNGMMFLWISADGHHRRMPSLNVELTREQFEQLQRDAASGASNPLAAFLGNPATPKGLA